MTSCPNAHDLGNFLAGRLDDVTTIAISEHVEFCGGCQQKLEELTDNPSLAIALDGTQMVPPSAVAGGAVIAGRYALIEKIGEGGMGEVWVAKQNEPVKRKIALKLIKSGMDSKAVLARFEQERQALAMMDHPNIAKVLDGGIDLSASVAGNGTRSNGTGLPFFVMELVNGLPLTKFCDQMKLTPRERLELFIPICHAVQHAHQKGIIHRDLKPSNVLVTLVDGQGLPKVIDFGVAKAIEGRLTEATLYTQFGVVVGTLEYMAPEQAGLSGQDVDTRADIYSLGVMLYELLTGLPPHDAKRLRRSSLDEMIRIIREEEPSKPSNRLAFSESLPSLAALRQTEPNKLKNLLRGELDWIVMKCLEKQRNRRYESASSLARDIQRYLVNEPVEARPPTARYRMGKFVRRNRGPVLAATFVLLSLIAGIVGTTWGLVRANAQRRIAEEARSDESDQRQAADIAREEALRREKAERWERYRANMSAVSSSIQLHNVGAARRALEATPEEHRNWEWRYFFHQLDSAHFVQRAPDQVGRVVFAPGGRTIAMINNALPIRFWDVIARKEIDPLQNISQAYFMEFSPDGKTIVYPEGDTFIVREIGADRSRVLLRGHEQKGVIANFSPDGTRLVTGSSDRTARVWDSATGEQLLLLRGHEDEVSDVVFSPDGRRIASCGRLDHTVRLWDAETGHPIAVLGGHEASVSRVMFSPQGDRVLSLEYYPGNTLRLWDAATGQPLAVMRGHTNTVPIFVFSLDGTRIASCSWDQTVRLWDGNTGSLLATMQGHRGRVYSVAFSPDGSRLVSASQDQTVRLWDARTGEPLAVLLGHTADVLGATYTIDGAQIVSFSADYGSIRLFDAQSVERSGVLRGHTSEVYEVAFHPDGVRVASASWDGTARLWDVATGRQIALLSYPQKTIVTSVVFHPAGQLLATLGRDDAVRLWDVATAKEVHRFSVSTNTFRDSRLAFSSQGDLLATGSFDNAVHVWNVNSRDEVAVLRGHTDFVRDVVFSNDGAWLASGGEVADPTIRIWDVAAKEQARVLEGHTNAVYALAVSHNGKWLASGSTDGTVRLWDTTTWQTIAVLKHGTNVYGVTFSKDDTRLACACANNTIRFWDMATQQEVAELHGHTSYVHSVKFNRDGSRLVSSSGDNTVRVWDIVPPHERTGR